MMQNCVNCGKDFNTRYSNVIYCFNCACHIIVMHNHNVFICTLENLYNSVGGNLTIYSQIARYVRKPSFNIEALKKVYL